MAGNGEKLRLVLVEDEPLYRDLLRIALDQRPSWRSWRPTATPIRRWTAFPR